MHVEDKHCPLTSRFFLLLGSLILWARRSEVRYTTKGCQQVARFSTRDIKWDADVLYCDVVKDYKASSA